MASGEDAGAGRQNQGMYRGTAVCLRAKGSSGASNGSGRGGGDSRAGREARRLPHDVVGMIQCVPVCCNSVPNPWGARPSGRTAGPTNRRPDQPQTVAGRGATPLLLSNPSVCHFKPHPERKVPHTDRRTAQKVLFVPLRAGRAGADPRLRHRPDVFDRKRRGALGGRPPTAGGRGKEDEQR